MSDVIRYAMAGVGMMGREHIANIRALPGTQVVAIADTNTESLAQAQTITGLRDDSCFGTVGSMLDAGGYDVVVVSTPNHTHAAVMAEVLATDAHVLVEKPLGISVSDCRRILKAAENRRGLVWMGLEYRYKPAITRLVEEVRSGVIGPVRMVAIREHRFPFLVKVDNWNRFNRNTGGTLVEKCCHFFDLMRLITRSEPVRVYGSGSQAVNHLDETYEGERPDIIDNAYVVVDFESGARALLDLCMFAEGSRNEQELAVTGDIGKVEAFVPESTIRVGDRATRSTQETVVHDPRIAFEGLHEGSSYLEHLDFLETIRSGGRPKVTLNDGLRSVAMGVAAHLSIDLGRPVTMEEVL